MNPAALSFDISARLSLARQVVFIGGNAAKVHEAM